MLYFRGNHFYPFALDWQEQSNGRQIIPGLGIYFLDPSEGNWTLDEVERQMHFIRTHKLAGQAHYRVKYLMDNNYIPHENTGHATHKYRVRTEDAVRFKARMDTELPRKKRTIDKTPPDVG